ncbi:hypothetical protein V2J09_003872 [Rumex salicifolius]
MTSLSADSEDILICRCFLSTCQTLKPFQNFLRHRHGCCSTRTTFKPSPTFLLLIYSH